MENGFAVAEKGFTAEKGFAVAENVFADFLSPVLVVLLMDDKKNGFVAEEKGFFVTDSLVLGLLPVANENGLAAVENTYPEPVVVP